MKIHLIEVGFDKIDIDEQMVTVTITFDSKDQNPSAVGNLITDLIGANDVGNVTIETK